MAKASKRSTKHGRGGGRVSGLKATLLLLLALGIVAAAFYGLLSLDSSGRSQRALTPGGAPPEDHIDEHSRDRLREILREEGHE